MRPLLPALLVSLAAASLATPLHAQTTWVVDDNGGAGVDAIPANGTLTYTYDAPAAFAPGDLVALQAMVLTAEGYRLSNSATVVLR